MAVPPSNTPNLTRTGTFDPRKQYLNTRLQQGVPVVDVDVNDSQDYVQHQANEQIRSILGYAEEPHALYEWTVRPVTYADSGFNDRNIDNFAVSLGRLSTRFGIVDLRSWADPALTDYFVYDWKSIQDLAADIAQDRPYANYMFRGKVTATGTSSEVIDQNKDWHANHRLLGSSSVSLVVTGASAESGEDWALGSPISDHELVFDEGPCVVVVLTGTYAGESAAIQSHTATKLTLASPLPGVLGVGDTYVIVPANELATHRAAYNAALTKETTAITEGLAGGAWLFFYVQTWLEDTSPDEDPDLVHPVYPGDVTHRTELRWCVRVAQIRMSVDSDAGRAQLHPVHVRTLLSDVAYQGELRNRDLLDGGPRTPGSGYVSDPQDGRLFLSGWPTSFVGDPVDSGRAMQVPGPFGLGTALLTWHWLNDWTAQLYAHGMQRDYPDGPLLYEYIQGAMHEALTSDSAGPVGFSVLMAHFPMAKTDVDPANETLSAYWYPIETDFGSFPTTHSRLDLWASVVSGYASHGATYLPHTAIASQRPQAPMRAADIGQELMLARGVGYNRVGVPTTEFPGGFLVGSPEGLGGLLDTPLSYMSLHDHLAALDTAVFGALGLGHQMGTTTPLANAGSVGGEVGAFSWPPVAMASSKNFVFTGELDTLWQAGQSNLVWTYNIDNLLNPAAESRGAVTPLDPLVGASDGSGLDAATQGSPGAFVGGPGEYKTRAGQTIDADHERGWSFYRFVQSGEEFGSSSWSNTRPRGWQEGRAQAFAAREALTWRKLAIKTSAHDSMDMATYRIHHPDRIRVGDALKPAVASSAVGALQNPSQRYLDSGGAPEYVTSYNRDQTYDFGGETPSQSTQIAKGIESVEKTTGGVLAQPVRVDAAAGAWGRFPAVSSDTWAMWDQWEDRCTVFRLRYHIGDFYPGYKDPEDQHDADYVYPPNALVDTLNLFVRIEPLPLAHWATMPAHQHSALEDSFSLLDGMANWLADLYPLPKLDHLLNSSWEPLVTRRSPVAYQRVAVSTSGSPGFVTTSLDHGWETGDYVEIRGHVGSVPDLNGTHEIIVTGNRTFQLNGVTITGSGTGGDVYNESIAGEPDTSNTPFDHAHQQYIHWYHPNMEHIFGPHPVGGTLSSPGPSNDYGSDPEDHPVPYHKFGERSMIVPAIVFGRPGTDDDDKSGTINTSPNVPADWAESSGDAQAYRLPDYNPVQALTSTISGTYGLVTFVNDHGLRRGDRITIAGATANNGTHTVRYIVSATVLYVDSNFGGGGTGGTAQKWERIPDVLGTHASGRDDSVAAQSMNVEGSLVSIEPDTQYFPFVPPYDGAGPPALGDEDDYGLPGPVFLPAFRQFANDTRTADASDKWAMHPILTHGTTVGEPSGAEAEYFPKIDHLDDAAKIAAGGTWDWGLNTLPLDWGLPVLRSKLRTDTVHAILDLFDSTFAWPRPGYSAPVQGEQQAATGPDVNQDTMFVGDIGTSVSLDDAGAFDRVFFPSVNLLGGPCDFLTGKPVQPGKYGAEGATWDVFDYMQSQRIGAIPTYIPAAMNNTWGALRNQGLAQKLLWNSSFRILHTRPGGGYHDGLGGPIPRSDRARSLTELFLVRNREIGFPVSWPKSPNEPWHKPYIHLESIHPAAGAGAAPHPNHAYIGHLYSMIADTLGGSAVATTGGKANLYDTGGDTRITSSEFLSSTWATGATGDTFGADPYDYEWGKAVDSGDHRLARTDRLHQNSGIEIDLVSELRYVRENAALHGLDSVGTKGFSLLDTMPTVEELTAPGDHEILFVLHDGSRGQRMCDDATIPPEGEYYNPPVAGCRVVASIEVNRPNEKVSSDAGGSGRHYGEEIRVFNVLGHS